MAKANIPVRGFSSLVGETIVSIDASPINVVTFTLESGKIVEIDCDQHIPEGIAILRATVLPE